MTPDVFVRRKMYRELGGRIGYRMTPVWDLLECKLSIIAEMNVQGEQTEETKRKQAEQEAEIKKRMAEMNNHR